MKGREPTFAEYQAERNAAARVRRLKAKWLKHGSGDLTLADKLDALAKAKELR